jgi:hypothetical protein
MSSVKLNRESLTELRILAKLFWLKAGFEETRRKHLKAQQEFRKFLDSQLRRLGTKEPTMRKRARACRTRLRDKMARTSS